MRSSFSFLYTLHEKFVFLAKGFGCNICPERGFKYLMKVLLLHPTQLQILIFNWPAENMEAKCCSVLPYSTQSASH